MGYFPINLASDTYLTFRFAACGEPATTAHRVHLTTDAHQPYLSAVEDAFGTDIDYAVLQKLYGADPESEKQYCVYSYHKGNGRRFFLASF